MGDKNLHHIKETQPDPEKHWGLCLLEAAGIVGKSHGEALQEHFASARREDAVNFNVATAMNLRGRDTAQEDAYAHIG